MAWSNRSRRRSELPANWAALRVAVFTRDGGACQLALSGCQMVATECDHIGDRLDHSLPNLRAVCHRCHAKHTGQQAHAARNRGRRGPEPHPGIRPANR